LRWLEVYLALTDEGRAGTERTASPR